MQPDNANIFFYSYCVWIFFSPKMRTLLESGTTLIVDRYAYSGVSFTAAKEVGGRTCVRTICIIYNKICSNKIRSEVREINVLVNYFKNSPVYECETVFLIPPTLKIGEHIVFVLSFVLSFHYSVILSET